MTVTLPGGEVLPALGQGSWHLGQGRHDAAEEIAALQAGIDLGLTLIDTAEMYGDGASEALIGRAIAGRRDDVFLVSKVLPWNASYDGTLAACRASLERLGTDRLDLYLLHWRGGTPFAETIAGLVDLRDEGLIRHWGVSNLDPGELEEVLAAPGGAAVATDQVLYNLSRRGIEFDLLPWLAAHDVPLMAYSPIEQGRILRDPALAAVAARHDVTPAQVALAWVLGHDGVVAIPEAGTVAHVRENAAARGLALTPEDHAELDAAFPAPTRPVALEML
jgi:diketogulonate reductase-like aldo/keto reductase